MRIRSWSRDIIQHLALLTCCIAALSAEVPDGRITGVVTDATGAAVPGARVVLLAAGQPDQTRDTDTEGRYSFADLTPGPYQLRVTAQGFAAYEVVALKVTAGGRVDHDVRLVVTLARQEITVDSRVPLDVDPANNASTVTLRQSELTALSDDRDNLGEDLQALAGPAAGPNGGEIYVDGFSGGKLPPQIVDSGGESQSKPFFGRIRPLGIRPN